MVVHVEEAAAPSPSAEVLSELQAKKALPSAEATAAPAATAPSKSAAALSLPQARRARLSATAAGPMSSSKSVEALSTLPLWATVWPSVLGVDITAKSRLTGMLLSLQKPLPAAFNPSDQKTKPVSIKAWSFKAPPVRYTAVLRCPAMRKSHPVLS